MIKLRPSSSSTWLNCHAAPAFIEQLGIEDKDTETVYSIEGKEAHRIAEDLVWRFFNHYLSVSPCSDGEMLDHGMSYVNYIRGLIPTKQNLSYFGIETRVPLFYNLEKVGIIDFWCIVDGVLHVVDYKYGKGVKVHADSSQLFIYLISLYKQLAWIPVEIDKAVAHIVQPRIDNYDTHEYTIEEIFDLKNHVSTVASKIYAGSSVEFNPDPDRQCRFCPAKRQCKAYAGLVTKPYDLMNKLIVSDEEISEALRLYPALKKWVEKDLQPYAYSKLQQGENFPGWKLVAGREGNREWGDTVKAVTMLNEYSGRVDIWETKLISPAKAEKLIPEIKEEINNLVIRPDTKPIMAPETDKREAINSNLDYFESIEK